MIFYKEYKYHNPIILGRKGNKVDNNIYSFDIETTSYLKLDGVIYNPNDYEKLTSKQRDKVEFYSIMYI